jgi:hypothetical protein
MRVWNPLRSPYRSIQHEAKKHGFVYRNYVPSKKGIEVLSMVDLKNILPRLKKLRLEYSE